MGWLKNKVRYWLNNDEYAIASAPRGRNSITLTSDVDSIDSDRGIRFTAYKASGGTVIETNFYDRVKDRSYRSLHIIADGQDLGKEIGKIITMETLKA